MRKCTAARGIVITAAAALLSVTGCGAAEDVKAEGDYAQYAQRNLAHATDPCPGKVIKMDEADPIWCGMRVSNLSESQRTEARQKAEEMMSAEMVGAISDATASAAPTSEPVSGATVAPVDEPTEGDGVDEFVGVHPFESPVTTGQGNEISLGKPEKFTPSSSATSQGAGTKFKVTFTNTGDTPVDLSMAFSASAMVDQQPAESIYDMEKEIGGAPDTAVRPGKTVTFYIAFEGKHSGSWDVDLDGGGDTIMYSSDAE